MSRVANKGTRQAEEDLAIQDTLSMTEEERLDLLVHLIVDKIIEDEKVGTVMPSGLQGAPI